MRDSPLCFIVLRDQHETIHITGYTYPEGALYQALYNDNGGGGEEKIKNLTQTTISCLHLAISF